MSKPYSPRVMKTPKVTHVVVTDLTPTAKNKKLTTPYYTQVRFNKLTHTQRHPSLLHMAIYLATLDRAYELLGIGALAGDQVHWDALEELTF